MRVGSGGALTTVVVGVLGVSRTRATAMEEAIEHYLILAVITVWMASPVNMVRYGVVGSSSSSSSSWSS